MILEGRPRSTILPVVSFEPPVTCTLDADDLAGRIGDWRRVAGLASLRQAIPGGIRLTLPEIDVRALAELVVRERECCAFLSFAIVLDPGGVILEVTGPADAQPLIAALA